MKRWIVLFSLLIFPFLTTTQLPEPRIIKTPDYFDRWERSFFISELKYEISEILFDIMYFDVYGINDDHLYFMEQQRQIYDIPKNIYYRLVFKESWFGRFILSPVGARGYMQIMPPTFKWIKDRYKLDISDINDPFDNISAGTFYLNLMKEWVDIQYPNEPDEYRWKRALASYNAGYSVHYRAMYRYNETINYVKFILASNDN